MKASNCIFSNHHPVPPLRWQQKSSQMTGGWRSKEENTKQQKINKQINQTNQKQQKFQQTINRNQKQPPPPAKKNPKRNKTLHTVTRTRPHRHRENASLALKRNFVPPKVGIPLASGGIVHNIRTVVKSSNFTIHTLKWTKSVSCVGSCSPIAPASPPSLLPPLPPGNDFKIRLFHYRKPTKGERDP